MSLTVVPFAGKWESAWEAGVASSRNGTVFHTRRFLSYHPEGRFLDASILFLDGEKIVGLLPAARRTDDGKPILVSHPGASYGGIVLPLGAPMNTTGEMLSLLKEHARAEGYGRISLLRLPPVSLQREWSGDQQYWLYQQGWRMTQCEMDGAVNLRGLTEEKVMPSLTGKCRNMVRQAERGGVVVGLSDDFPAFWTLLGEVLSQRHGAKPTHTQGEIQTLKSLLPGQVRLLAAKRGGALVGGIILVTIHDRALYTLYMAQDYTSQQYHPMHLLLRDALCLAIREKRSVLHLGVSTEDGGTKINEGLFFFKESFGCRPVRRESWEIELN